MSASDRTQRQRLLDGVALAITALGDDLTGWSMPELVQLHEMGLDVARRTNMALAEREESHE